MAKKKTEAISPLVPVERQPYPVPENWCWIRLLSAFDNKTDSKKKLPQKEYAENGEIPVVDQGKELIGGYTDKIELSYSGDLPVVVFGDHTRCIKFVDFDFVQGADGIKVLIPKQFWNRKAFYYAFQTVNIPNMGYRRHYPLFGQFSIPLPPLAEQQRIVDRIESLFEKLDEAKEKVQEVLDSFEERKAAVLHRAFSGELTEAWRAEHKVEKTWESTYLANVVSGFKYGTSEKSNYANSGMPVFRIPNVTDDGISFDDMKFLPHENVSPEIQVHENDILIIRSNGSRDLVGKGALVPALDQPYTYGSFLIRITPMECVLPAFLVMFLNSSDARSQMFKKAKSSAGINNINSKELGAIKIDMPSLSEQTEIVRILDDFFAKEAEAKEKVEATLEAIEDMKKAILAKAFRGELGTNDPEEEGMEGMLKELEA